MSINLSKIKYKTWVEINKGAIRKNILLFRKLIKKQTQLWAVVKSNAYGHGLVEFSTVANTFGVDGFCVDSVIEGEKLRSAGIQKPILVLGPTLPNLYSIAVSNNITITISSFVFLQELAQSKLKPNFHIKIDSGMYRQGFYEDDFRKVIHFIKQYKLLSHWKGMYTHFSSAKDINYPTYTANQFKIFKKLVVVARKENSSTDFIAHAAATGGALLHRTYHLDAVRIGIGLYGLWPSKEFEVQLSDKIHLTPVLSWQSIISEIKLGKKGGYVGYDLSERLSRDTKLAIVPIGYWHGYDRKLSGCGEVLIRGHRCRVLGRISMDIIIVDITGVSCMVGDVVGLIGSQNKNTITASEVSLKTATTHYETITRINPLIQRVIV